jgi:NhaP-type Na+/H+ or K+/H+ antiporter
MGVPVVVPSLQFAFAYMATSLQPIADALEGRLGHGNLCPAAAGVMAWSCTRSAIGLVIALSIPATLPGGQPFHERDLILAVAALTIIGSVLMQGLTLGAFVERAALRDYEATSRRNARRGRRAKPWRLPWQHRGASTRTASTRRGRRCSGCASATALATRCLCGCCAKRI